MGLGGLCLRFEATHEWCNVFLAGLGRWKDVASHCALEDRTAVNIKDRWVALRKAYESGWKDERNKMPLKVKKMVREIMDSQVWPGMQSWWPS